MESDNSPSGQTPTSATRITLGIWEPRVSAVVSAPLLLNTVVCHARSTFPSSWTNLWKSPKTELLDQRTSSSPGETLVTSSQQQLVPSQPGPARPDSSDAPTHTPSRFTKCCLFGNLSPRTKRRGGVGDRTGTDPAGPMEQKLQLRQQAVEAVA